MKENQNKSFVLYTDYAKHIALLTNEEAGELLKALFEYVEFGTQPGFSGALMMCFSFIADQIARDKEKYQDVCKKRAEAGRKGGKQKKANLANAKNETLCLMVDIVIDIRTKTGIARLFIVGVWYLRIDYHLASVQT